MQLLGSRKETMERQDPGERSKKERKEGGKEEGRKKERKEGMSG